MTERDRNDFLNWLKKYKEEIRGDKKKARELLIGAGIITEKGNFRKPYKHLCIPSAGD
jgi:hypothetical protein